MTQKPYSQSCENNKSPILEVIREVFKKSVVVWEIGSGTGQHACYFASQLPHLIWQPTDVIENLAGIKLWHNDASLDNLNEPLLLDVTQTVWPCEFLDALFTANTLHIMSWQEVTTLFERLGYYLSRNALLCIYGPFNYLGRFTSESNAQFDQWLKERNPHSGIRDFESVVALAANQGLSLLKDFMMPANNRLLVFQKTE